MTLAEIAYLVQDEYGSRNQLDMPQILRLLSQVQMMAFDRDTPSFLYWDYFFTRDPLVPEGPYSFPNDPAHPDCRTILGLTGRTDMDVLRAIRNGETREFPNLFVPLWVNQVTRSFTIVGATDDVTPYRLLYYIRPREFEGVTDDERLLIPPEYHHTILVQGAGLLAQYHLQGKPAPRAELNALFAPWWFALESVESQYNPEEYISKGQPGF